MTSPSPSHPLVEGGRQDKNSTNRSISDTGNLYKENKGRWSGQVTQEGTYFALMLLKLSVYVEDVLFLHAPPNPLWAKTFVKYNTNNLPKIESNFWSY